MAYESKIHVCLWVPRYWPAMGGTELHTRQLAQHLSTDSHVTVLTHCVSSAKPEYSVEQDAVEANQTACVDGKVSVKSLNVGGPLKILIRAVAKKHRSYKWIRPIYSVLFYSHLRRQGRDLTQNSNLLHFVYNGLTDSAILAAGIAAKKNIPFVFTPNTLNTSNNAHAWNSRRFMTLYASATRIIALTQHEADWLETLGIPRQKIAVVPYGPILQGNQSGQSFRDEYQLGQSKIILFLSRIIPSKGYQLLLDACEPMWKQHPDTRVVFMGPATDEARASILSSGDPRILLLEAFSQEVKADALAACDVLCVPSNMESLGVVYIEAAFNAKPVVALDIPVLRDFIEHNENGLLVEERADAIATALIYLLVNPSIAVGMGLRGLNKAKSEYSWKSVKEKIDAVYQQAIDKPEKGSWTRIIR